MWFLWLLAGKTKQNKTQALFNRQRLAAQEDLRDCLKGGQLTGIITGALCGFKHVHLTSIDKFYFSQDPELTTLAVIWRVRNELSPFPSMVGLEHINDHKAPMPQKFWIFKFRQRQVILTGTDLILLLTEYLINHNFIHSFS